MKLFFPRLYAVFLVIQTSAWNSHTWSTDLSYSAHQYKALFPLLMFVIHAFILMGPQDKSKIPKFTIKLNEILSSTSQS